MSICRKHACKKTREYEHKLAGIYNPQISNTVMNFQVTAFSWRHAWHFELSPSQTLLIQILQMVLEIKIKNNNKKISHFTKLQSAIINVLCFPLNPYQGIREYYNGENPTAFLDNQNSTIFSSKQYESSTFWRTCNLSHLSSKSL